MNAIGTPFSIMLLRTCQRSMPGPNIAITQLLNCALAKTASSHPQESNRGPPRPSVVLIGSCDLVDNIDIPPNIPFVLWYLDDRTIVVSWADAAHVLKEIQLHGPDCGLFFNLDKCEVFWPSGDNSFPEFPSNISKPKDGISFFGAPLWGSQAFFNRTIAHTIDIVQEYITKSV